MSDTREPRRRIEPALGEMPAAAASPRPSPPSRPPLWRERRVWRRAAIALAALAAVVVAFRHPLADRLWPDTRVQRLLDAGDAALEAGKLTAADGSGARQYYEAAQALDNDRNEARAGLTRVANAALGQARAALRADRPDQARAALQLARELQAPLAETNSVAEELRRLEVARAGLDGLLRQAQAAQGAGRLDGDPDAALPLYARILALQPNDTAALEGREDALADLLQQADRALADGDLARGAALVAAARGYDAGHVDLPAAQAKLSAALERARVRADADLRAGRLERAAGGYRAALAAAGDDAAQAAAARQGLERVASAWAARARGFAADFRFADADAALTQARAASPRNDAAAAAGQYLQRVRRSHAQSAAAALSPPQRRQRAHDLIARMEAAQARGDWMTPPGESAYDRLRTAQALAPDDKAVGAAAARLADAARACFEGELSGNRPTRARACLDAWAAVDAGDARLDSARKRLAQKWLAVGDERLGAGDMAFAAQALRQARELDPAAPGLAQFARRVRDARGGG